MVSRRRLFPWIQSYWRRGGVSPTQYLLLVLIFATSAITLFIRTNSNQTFDVLEGPDAQEAQHYSNVKFVEADPAVLADKALRDKKAILKRAPLNDTIAEIFNEKAVEVREVEDKQEMKEKEKVHEITSERKKVEPILADKEDKNSEDFAELAAEEFVPPNDLLNIMNKFAPIMKNSFIDVAKKVAPVLAQTINGDNEGNFALNLMSNALPLLLGSESKSPSSSSDQLGSVFKIAKMFLGAKSGFGSPEGGKRRINNDVDNTPNSSEKSQFIKDGKHKKIIKENSVGEQHHDSLSNNVPEKKFITQNTSFKEMPRENSRLPLSVVDSGNDSKSHENNKKVSNTFSAALKKITTGNWNPKKTYRTPKWILDSLNEKSRETSAKEIKNIYKLLMKNWNLIHKRDSCEKIVPYSKSSPEWKEDDFRGTQFVCEDLDFGVYFQRNCIVYSFGIGDDWSFEEAMAEKDCEIWAFDLNAEKPVILSSKIHFFNNIFLGSKNEEQTINGKRVKYYTLESIITKLRHSKRNITYLKIDINGEEWPILEQIINETPLVLNSVLQIGIKTHLHTAMMDHTLYGQYFNLLQQLPALGYQMFTTVKVQDNLDDVYEEPLLNNKEVSLTNYAAYFRL